MSTLITTDNTNDLFLDGNNDIAVSRSRLEEIKQLVNNKLQTFLGEIPLDTNEGVDYFDIMLEKLIPLETKLNELTNKILEVSGVLGIENIDYSATDNKSQNNFDILIKTDAGNFSLQDLSLLV